MYFICLNFIPYKKLFSEDIVILMHYSVKLYYNALYMALLIKRRVFQVKVIGYMLYAFANCAQWISVNKIKILRGCLLVKINILSWVNVIIPFIRILFFVDHSFNPLTNFHSHSQKIEIMKRKSFDKSNLYYKLNHLN